MLVIPESLKQAIKAKLQILYGTKAEETLKEIEEVLKTFYMSLPKDLTQYTMNEELHKFHYKDIILNVYANSIQGKQGTPLQVLYRFTERLVLGTINGIHILPFFPWDTDRGFSVLNYYEVDKRNGSWDDFTALNNVFDILMVDCVVNHASIDNPIVQKALTGDPDYKNFVITYTEEEKPDQNDLLKITRPRPNPVLTQYYVYVDKNKKLRASFDKLSSEEISKGVILRETGWVWTTFSRPDNPDGTVATRQVDFNFSNPKLFLEFIKIFLFYISKGTRWIRLDAIPYLWKEIGTSCIHLPETHLVSQIFNDIFKILDFLRIVLVAEVNEAQEKVLPYLGKEGAAEGDLVYLFTHFPLAVHAVLTGTAKYYMNWIPSLERTQGRLFISVLGTHDGMGLKPVSDWLPSDEKERLQSVLINKHGVLPNYSSLPGGQKIIYELCATPWNLINETESDEPLSLQVNRYIAVLALGLTIRGIPSVYINGLLGIPNYEGKIDENRTINRQILAEDEIYEHLKMPESQIYNVFMRVMDILKKRREEKAFDPRGQLVPHSLNESVVSVLLTSSDGEEKLFAMINVSDAKQSINIQMKDLRLKKQTILKDIISGEDYRIERSSGGLNVSMEAYQVCWLKIKKEDFKDISS